MDVSKVRSLAKDYLAITLACFIFAWAWEGFMIPCGMSAGGMMGLSTIIQYATGGLIPAQYTYIAINALLILIAVFAMGIGFGFKTIYAIMMSTLAMHLIAGATWLQCIPGEFFYVKDTLLVPVIAGTLEATGLGLVIRFGGSTASPVKAAPAANAPVYLPSEPKVVEKIVEKVVEKEVVKEVVKEVKVPVGNTVDTYNDDLFFVIGKAEIRPEEAFKLGRICQVLAENPDAKITVTGYADSGTGNHEINSGLSEQRAARVVDMLVKAGIDRSRITSDAVAGDRDASRSPESNRVAVCIVK